MTIGLTPEHEALRDAVRGWTGRHVTREVLRQAADASADSLPACWEKLAAQGLLGVHLPAEYGDGYGLLELAVVLEELARALTPGPILPTVLASALVARGGSSSARDRLLPGLADGSIVGAVALEPGLVAEPSEQGFRVRGSVTPVAGGCLADVVVASAHDADGGEVWFVLDTADAVVTPVAGVDLTRRLARLELNGVQTQDLLTDLTGDEVRALAGTLAAAEAAGVAGWCVETAAEYAKTRVQFGRPIGQFQAVKHRCAEMLLAVEQARAAVWDAARALVSKDAGTESLFAAGVAAMLGPDAAVRCAQDCIQVLGGIGFTWEHDAHLYLRRALALRALTGGSAGWARRVGDAALAGERRPVELELPPDADALRDATRTVAAELAALDPAALRARMAADGWLVPHLPAPWGRDAGPLEQLVAQQEFAAAGVRTPDLVIGAWVVPTLVGHGSDTQRDRFLPPTLRGELTWCQLFSEPGAGSDLAALSTRAERVDGGWRLTGQKIWTSVAQHADWGICLARTDPDAAKHRGISYFLVDMRTPGIDVRPLRELTGQAMFNEVFLDGVLVPDDCLVGEPGDGWRLARTTLANERVALSSGWAMGAGVADLIALIGAGADVAVRQELGELVCAEQAFALLGLRATLRRLSGLEPGPTSSTRKLLGIRHAQRVAEYGWSLLGVDGALAEGPTATWPELMLSTRAMSIAGGTTEVQLNILAERLLGLPRD
jgi:alkylation response protein AidB-like acyl-CoA dehydrogenase